jgi:hypothetical protein
MISLSVRSNARPLNPAFVFFRSRSPSTLNRQGVAVMGQGIESQLVEALAIGTRDLRRHRDSCPAFARSRAPWCRRRSATPGRRRSAAPGRRRSAAPGRRRSAAPGRRRSATPGRRRSATPGQRRSATPGRGATPPLSAKSRYVRLQPAASLRRQEAARRHALATRMRPRAMGLRRHATGARCHCGPCVRHWPETPLSLCRPRSAWGQEGVR